MRLFRPLLWVLAFGTAAMPAWSQAPKLQFLDRIKDDAVVSGAVAVKVSRDPILRPRGIKIGIEVDGELKETAESVPWTYTWDSSSAPDGKHTIRLVIVNLVT